MIVRRWLRDKVALVVLAMLVVGMGFLGARAQGGDELAGLQAQVSQLYGEGKHTEAIPIAERYVALARQKHGEDHTEFATANAWLAFVYQAQGRYADAEPLLKRSLAIIEKAHGPDHRDVGTALDNLAGLYRAQSRYDEAEPLYKRSIDIAKKVLGTDHPDVATSLNNLAELYGARGRHADAEPLLKRSLAIIEKAHGPDHPEVGTRIGSLAMLYRYQGRYADAEPLQKRALAITEKALGPDHPHVGALLNNLADIYKHQGRYADAEPLYQRAVSIYEKGANLESVATSIDNLADLYDSQGRYAEAEPLYERAASILGDALGPDNPHIGSTLNNLAWLHFVQRSWARAADFWRRSTAVIMRRAQRGTDTIGRALAGKGSNEAEHESHRFWALVKVTYRLVSEERGAEASLAHEMFQTAQWARGSEAAAALAQMAARGAKDNPALEALVRERQDLVGEWQKQDQARSAAVSLAPDKRDRVAEAANTARLAAIDARIGEIDARLRVEFPDYAALASPSPLAVGQVQSQLRAEEALVLFLDTPEAKPTPEETFIWVITKTDMRWVRSDLGTKALTREVAALRCGLDAMTWVDAADWSEATEELVRQKAAQIARRQLCEKLVKTKPRTELFGAVPIEVLPFDHARAYTLYRALFGEVEDLIKGKDLLIVPTGPLTQLPFQVLVTSPPTNGENKSAAWLARNHALTVLPAVTSLKALRRVVKSRVATKPMIGFGNPLLEGDQGDPQYGPYYKRLAAVARERQNCAVAQRQDVASLRGGRRGLAPLATRGGRR